MDEHVQSFLGDVLANPHDDVPRLIFADWIEDHAAALPAEVRNRGQLIRVQYALEGLDGDDPRRAMLQTREGVLIQTHLFAWARGIIPSIHRPTFRRGFVEGMTLSLGGHATIEHPERLAPVRRLTLEFFLPRPAPTVRIPAVSQIEDLDLTKLRYADNDVAVEWLGAVNAPRLTSLSLRADRLAAAGPLLPRLERLALRGPWPYEAERLAVGRLRSLGLHGPTPSALAVLVCQLDGPSLRHLQATGLRMGSALASPLLPDALKARLEHLDLSNGRIDLARLTAEGPFPSLRRLALSGSTVEGSGLAALTYGTAFPALRSLNLRSSRLSEQAVGVLLGSPLVSRLEALYIGYNRIGAEPAFALLPRLPHALRTLDLSWNPIGDLAVGQIARSDAAATLEALDLSYCSLGPDAAYQLLLFPPDAALVALNLGTNRLDDDGLSVLLDSAAFARLEALDLSNNRLTDRGVAALEAWPRLRDVSLLALHGNAISPDALSRLRERFAGLLL